MEIDQISIDLLETIREQMWPTYPSATALGAEADIRIIQLHSSFEPSRNVQVLGKVL